MAVAVVTGANRGIGLSLAEQLAERGDEVIAICRRNSKALDATGAEVFDGIDVTDAADIAKFRDRMSGRKIDMLINNAGLLHSDTLDNLDWDQVREQFEVNALAPLRLTRALVRLFARGAKVGIVTSRVGSLEDNGSGNNYGYRMSKAAVNMAGVNLSHDLRPHGVAVFLLHPGYVKTDMTHGRGYIGSKEAASGLLARLDELDITKSGSFWHAEGYELPW